MTTTGQDTSPFYGQPVLRTAYQQSVADYWNAEKNPVNLRLGEVDGIYHHHYGIGDVDWSVLEGPADDPEDRHHRRDAPAGDAPRPSSCSTSSATSRPSDRLLDAGSGRGGTSFMANLRFGCRVDGMSHLRGAGRASPTTRRRAAGRGRQGAPSTSATCSTTASPTARSRRSGTTRPRCTWTCTSSSPSTPALLAPGGRYVTITGCYNDVTAAAVPGGQPDRRALHLRHPPAQRVLRGDGRQRPGADQRHRPDRRHHPVLGAAGAVVAWRPASRRRS